MVDATEGWNYTQAVETAHALQEAGAGWLEDPIDHQDYVAYRRFGIYSKCRLRW